MFIRNTSFYFILAFLLFSFLTWKSYYFCKENLDLRYSINGWMSSPQLWTKYFDLNSELRKIGVSEKARVISIKDDSPEISLYLMNQRGITISGYENDETIGNRINQLKGPDSFIIINDTSYLSRNINGITGKPVMADINGIYVIKND